MPKTALIIVFNHRFDRNIPVLEKMYGGRFSTIWFLVPFYDGHHPRVIPVYESSNYFQSFFAQGYGKFYNPELSHYLFLGDDCILHPALNESNIGERTGLPDGADFVPSLNDFREAKGRGWWHTFKGIDFFGNRKGAEIAAELPTRSEAVNRFRRHGLEVRPLSGREIFGNSPPANQSSLEFFLFRQYHLRYKWRRFRKNGRIELPYPITGSYSDLLIVSKESIQDFCRFCGIMAAAGLFVEIAIPTALVLASQKIITEDKLKLSGKALWTKEEIAEIEGQYHLSLRELLDGFPASQLFYHPVKLSKWKNDL